MSKCALPSRMRIHPLKNVPRMFITDFSPIGMVSVMFLRMSIHQKHLDSRCMRRFFAFGKDTT